MKKTKLILIILILSFAFALLAAYVHFSPIFAVGNGYCAKILCSSVFISGRSADSVINEELNAQTLSGIKTRIDEQNASAQATILGIFKSRAVYRPGLGCTLCVDGANEIELRQQALDVKKPEHVFSEKLWPDGDSVSGEVPDGVDQQALKEAVNSAFVDVSDTPFRTRAVVVVYDGCIVAERYAPGNTENTPLLGWSMTKSVTNALVGILVRQGKLHLKDTGLMPAWRNENDPRKDITLDQLLRMSSGLEFVEQYEDNVTSDVNIMLFTKYSTSDYAADKPLAADPDTKWSYSSGTTNILARIAREASRLSQSEWFRFPGKELFDKIGMNSAVIEPDPSGNFVGSSYMYATARDWARFGLLYLNDGIWHNERILPDGWVQYSTTPTVYAAPGKAYGAQFWLNFPNPNPRLPYLPDDAFMALGHETQAVVVIPSRKTVIVRLGLYRGPDFEAPLAFMKDVMKSLPET